MKTRSTPLPASTSTLREAFPADFVVSAAIVESGRCDTPVALVRVARPNGPAAGTRLSMR